MNQLVIGGASDYRNAGPANRFRYSYKSVLPLNASRITL